MTRDGSIVYRFRKPWRNGKQAVVMDPMTFLSRLAALIPPPRFHMLSNYGVLAPAASRRDEIVPRSSSGLPSSLGLICIGFQKAAVPYLGGMLLTRLDVLVYVNLTSTGVKRPVIIPSAPTHCGLTVYLQMLQLDTAASHGVSFTPGLELTLGR